MPALEVTALHKRYGSVEAVRDLSLSVEPGSVYGLLGPNGSGKTTSLGCILGLLRPTSGRISVLGEPPARLYRTRGRVGVVFDTSILVRGLSVRQQLRYSARLFGHRGGRELDDALEEVGIAHLADRTVTRLSLGQQKRLAVATALAGAPEILFLDEPLAGLDPLGVRGLLRLIGELARGGLTIVLSSHRLHELETVLTHAAILMNGRMARSGPMAELTGGPGRYRACVDDTERALRVASSFEGTRVELGDTAGALVLDCEPQEVARLNRAWVEAGLAVSELSPLSIGLPQLFDQLVDEAEASQ